MDCGQGDLEVVNEGCCLGGLVFNSSSQVWIG